MFEDDKYKSYITLCRELCLKHGFEDGDFFWHPDIQVGDWLGGDGPFGYGDTREGAIANFYKDIIASRS